MTTPAALMRKRICCSSVAAIGDRELVAWIQSLWSSSELVRELVSHDRIYLVPRVLRFISAYLDADERKKVDFLDAISFSSRGLGCPSLPASTLHEDIAAAISIANKASMIVEAADCDEGSGNRPYAVSTDLALLPDAFAALAFVYRYMIGLYEVDCSLNVLGRSAARLVLWAESRLDTFSERATLAMPSTFSAFNSRAWEQGLALSLIWDNVAEQQEFAETSFSEPIEPALRLAG